jgi:hypothetical protein
VHCAHTCSLRSVFAHVHAAVENFFILFAALCGKLCEALLTEGEVLWYNSSENKPKRNGASNMILIECFTRAHVDNIAACLYMQPEKMVMIGDAREMAEPAQRYRQLLRQRGQRTELILYNSQRKSLEDICAILERVVQQQEKYVIDLTGGDETVIMAVGALLARLDERKRQNIQIHKFEHNSGVLVDCISGNYRVLERTVSLTIQELIALHGGVIHPQAESLPESTTGQDIDGLWELVSAGSREWNRSVMLLNEMERWADSKMEVDLPVKKLQTNVRDFDEKEGEVRVFLDQLQRSGIIADRSCRDALKYTYTTALGRYCTQKAGNVLEVKTLLEGTRTKKDGMDYFHDCRMSVSIDWDGQLHDPTERIPETRNEIDVVLMRGMTPLFISCKNGNIGEEELYKLHTVAHRFGGPYARKMLIATDLDQKSPAANRSFIQRAWDMDIFLETDAAELSREKWQRLLIQAME